MPTARELRTQLGLPASTKSEAVFNHALRRLVPGGAEVLDTLTRLHEMQHGRNRPDPALADMLADMLAAKAKMIAALQHGAALPETRTEDPQP